MPREPRVHARAPRARPRACALLSGPACTRAGARSPGVLLPVKVLLHSKHHAAASPCSDAPASASAQVGSGPVGRAPRRADTGRHNLRSPPCCPMAQAACRAPADVPLGACPSSGAGSRPMAVGEKLARASCTPPPPGRPLTGASQAGPTGGPGLSCARPPRAQPQGRAPSPWV